MKIDSEILKERIYLEAARDIDAEKLAKQKSGLGRFDSWCFFAREIK